MKSVKQNKQDQQGIALIIVLGFLAILTLYAVAFSIDMRVERQLAEYSIYYAKQQFIGSTARARIMQDIDKQLYGYVEMSASPNSGGAHKGITMKTAKYYNFPKNDPYKRQNNKDGPYIANIRVYSDCSSAFNESITSNCLETPGFNLSYLWRPTDGGWYRPINEFGQDNNPNNFPLVGMYYFLAVNLEGLLDLNCLQGTNRAEFNEGFARNDGDTTWEMDIAYGDLNNPECYTNLKHGIQCWNYHDMTQWTPNYIHMFRAWKSLWEIADGKRDIVTPFPRIIIDPMASNNKTPNRVTNVFMGRCDFDPSYNARNTKTMRSNTTWFSYAADCYLSTNGIIKQRTCKKDANFVNLAFLTNLTNLLTNAQTNYLADYYQDQMDTDRQVNNIEGPSGERHPMFNEFNIELQGKSLRQTLAPGSYEYRYQIIFNIDIELIWPFAGTNTDNYNLEMIVSDKTNGVFPAIDAPPENAFSPWPDPGSIVKQVTMHSKGTNTLWSAAQINSSEFGPYLFVFSLYHDNGDLVDYTEIYMTNSLVKQCTSDSSEDWGYKNFLDVEDPRFNWLDAHWIQQTNSTMGLVNEGQFDEPFLSVNDDGDFWVNDLFDAPYNENGDTLRPSTWPMMVDIVTKRNSEITYTNQVMKWENNRWVNTTNYYYRNGFLNPNRKRYHDAPTAALFIGLPYGMTYGPHCMALGTNRITPRMASLIADSIRFGLYPTKADPKQNEKCYDQDLYQPYTNRSDIITRQHDYSLFSEAFLKDFFKGTIYELSVPNPTPLELKRAIRVMDGIVWNTFDMIQLNSNWILVEGEATAGMDVFPEPLDNYLSPFESHGSHMIIDVNCFLHRSPYPIHPNSVLYGGSMVSRPDNSGPHWNRIFERQTLVYP